MRASGARGTVGAGGAPATEAAQGDVDAYVENVEGIRLRQQSQ